MSGIDKAAQFIVSRGWSHREKRFRPEKVMNAITVVAAGVESEIL